MKVIPIKERNKYKCHFCGNTKSVKYFVKVLYPFVENKNEYVSCCNKCCLKFKEFIYDDFDD